MKSGNRHIHLNIITKSRGRTQSDFRVHFKIMGFYSKEFPDTKVVDIVAKKINEYYPVHIVQIANRISNEHVDVSVGLANDFDAVQFLQKFWSIYLPDASGKEHEYMILTSLAFQTFLKEHDKMKKGNEFQQKQMRQYQNQIDSTIMKNQGNIKNLQEESKIKKLWLFGIPAEYDAEQVVHILEHKGYQVLKWEWKAEDIMDFLQVDINTNKSEQFIDEQLFEIDGYPFIGFFSNLIYDPTRNLLEYQLDVFVPEPMSEETVIRFFSQMGEVVVLLRNEGSAQEQFYTVVFSQKKSVMKTKQNLRQYLKGHSRKPQYPVKVGRIGKFYCFKQVLQSI